MQINLHILEKNRWKRCIGENPDALDEIIEVYLPILRNKILRLNYSKELFDRDMNAYVKDYLKIWKKRRSK